MRAAPVAAAAERNTAPIREVLEVEFRTVSRVLEIGSGTGQHAVAFGAAFDWLTWQTSDLEENHAAIQAWIDSAELPNVLGPLLLDVRESSAVPETVDAIFTANTAHIMSIAAVAGMFDFAGHALGQGGRFCLYGPLRVGQRFSMKSNADFDAALRSRDPAMGIRDLEELDEFAAASGLERRRRYAMPSNNELVTWHKR